MLSSALYVLALSAACAIVQTTSALLPSLTSAYSKRTTFSSSAQPTSSPQYCDAEYSCLNCTAVRVCSPTGDGQHLEEITRFSCPDDNPWCNPESGTCTINVPDNCPSPLPAYNFTCMKDGLYPDAISCSIYHHCEHGIASSYSCFGSSPYYSPFYQKCVSKVSLCTNFNDSVCAGKSGVKAALQGDDRLFVYCLNGKVLDVDRCIGGYIFDLKSQTCSPHCPHAGLFPSDEDCTQYYRCSPASDAPGETNFVLTTNLTCPAGLGFLEEEFLCVDRNMVPNCNVPWPGLFNL